MTADAIDWRDHRGHVNRLLIVIPCRPRCAAPQMITILKTSQASDICFENTQGPLRRWAHADLQMPRDDGTKRCWRAVRSAEVMINAETGALQPLHGQCLASRLLES